MNEIVKCVIGLIILFWIWMVLIIPFNITSIAESLKGIYEELKKMNKQKE